ncbi:LINE-1 retrotransposable element ORF2 protein [Bienertia sinuspersici]
MEKERQAQQMYKTKNKAYISFLKQKAKIQWIRDGDENSALFHSSIKRRRLQNNVYAIKDHQGNWQDTPVGVEQAFVNYYQELLGQKMEGRWEVKREIVQQGPVLNDQQQERLITTFTDEDIKKAFFSMNGDKAPGPDGFGAHFYKHNWDIVGPAVIKATRSFLE